MGNDDSLTLKRELLLFDRIGIPGLKSIVKINYDKQTKTGRSTAADMEWLSERNILFDPALLPPPSKNNPSFIPFSKAIEEHKATINEQPDLKKIMASSHHGEELFGKKNFASCSECKAYMDHTVYLMSDYVARAMAILTEAALGIEAIPVVQNMELPCTANGKKVDVLQIVLRSLPVPNETTPLEAIIDFRNDNEAQKRLLALRKWIADIAHSSFDKYVIDELEFLLSQYDEYMSVNVRSIKRSSIQALVIGGAELVENLVKLRFKKVASQLFTIGNANVALMKEELKAPGRVVSYVWLARQRFESSKAELGDVDT